MTEEAVKEKPKRRAISKKLRFEVFKRDCFTCQYCGRKAPDVILEIDHIKPVSQGGKNTLLNLITSCKECNRGKGKRLLTEKQTLEKERKQLELLQERKEQLKMMLEWQEELIEQDQQEVDFIEKIIFGPDYELNDYGRRKVLSNIKRFGFNAIVEAANIAVRQYDDYEERFRKLGGIAYNKMYKDGT